MQVAGRPRYGLLKRGGRAMIGSTDKLAEKSGSPNAQRGNCRQTRSYLLCSVAGRSTDR